MSSKIYQNLEQSVQTRSNVFNLKELAGVHSVPSREEYQCTDGDCCQLFKALELEHHLRPAHTNMGLYR